MEIERLKEFVVLAETGNFTEAAELLFVSQSSLSKHIKNIEDELGVELFDRTTRTVKISKYGRLLLPYAKKIVDLQDQYNSVLQSNLASSVDVLTIGSIRSLAQYNITEIIANFKQIQPQTIVKVHRASMSNTLVGSQKLKEDLKDKKCDLAFIRFFIDEDEALVKIPYATDNLVAVVPAKHPLAKKKSVPLETLSDMRFLFLEEQSYIYAICKKACQDSGFEPNIVFTDSKPENLIEFVTNGFGIALLMKQLAVYLSNPEIAIVEITPIVQSELCLTYLKGTKLTKAAKQFIKCTEEQRDKLNLIPKINQE